MGRSTTVGVKQNLFKSAFQSKTFLIDEPYFRTFILRFLMQRIHSKQSILPWLPITMGTATKSVTKVANLHATLLAKSAEAICGPGAGTVYQAQLLHFPHTKENQLTTQSV